MDKNQEMEIWGQCLDQDLSGDDLHGFLLEKCGGKNESYDNIIELMGFDHDDTLTPPEENLIATIISEDQAVETETKIEGFDIIEEVGRGGMGVILKAYDKDMRRTVAVKVLREKHRHNQYVIKRFSLEPRIAGHVCHTGIPPIYSHGITDDGRPYFSMKLIEGNTLSQIMKEECCQTDSRLLSIFRSVCATIAYTHDCGIVNLDLKSQNVMVGKFGEVQVTDWGISQRFEDGEGPASLLDNDIEDDQVVGTVGIMPPEQLSGNVELLKSPTCDVYSLGVMLGQIITNDRRATDARLRDSLLADCKASKMLIDASMKCISKDQADRYQHASDLLIVIDDYLESERARRKEAEVKLVAASRSFGRMSIALGVVCSALLVAMWSCWGIYQATDTLRLANSGLSEANAAKAVANRKLGDALHSSNSMVASELLSLPFVSRKMIIKMSDGVYDGTLSKRVLMSKLNRGIISRVESDPVSQEANYETIKGIRYMSAISTDGSRFLVNAEGGSVGIWRDNEDPVFLDCGYFGTATCISFDDDHACVGTHEGNVIVFDIGGNQLAMNKVVRAHATKIDRVSVDGDTITTNANSTEVKSSIDQDFYEESIAGNGSTHSTSSDGSHTVVVNNDGFVRICNNRSRTKLRTIKRSLMNASWAISNNGETVVGVSDDWATVIHKGNTKELKQVDMGSVKGVVIDSKNERFSLKRKFGVEKGSNRWQISLHDMNCELIDVVYTGRKQAWVHFSPYGKPYVVTGSGRIYCQNNKMKTIYAHERSVKASAANDSGFVVADDKGLVTRYFYKNGELVRGEEIDTGNEQITDIAVSRSDDQAMIVTTKASGTWIYSMLTGSRIASIRFDCDKASFGYKNNTVYTQAKNTGIKTAEGVTRWTIE